MSNIIGSINNELNIIRAKYRETGECSESYTKYYNQIEQPTTVKEVLTGRIIDLNFFGGYSDRLINPLVYWNGFYIQPYRITDLLNLIAVRRIIYNEKFITDINEISDYIFAYKEGFELGYEKFDSIEIEKKSSVFKSDKLSIEKILNYIEQHKESNGGFAFQWYPKIKYDLRFSSDGTAIPRVDKIPFPIEDCKERQLNGVCSERMLHNQQTGNECHACIPFEPQNLKKWKSEGYEGGKYYRAWFIVLANYQIFDEYFNSRKETVAKIESIVFVDPQQKKTDDSVQLNQNATPESIEKIINRSIYKHRKEIEEVLGYLNDNLLSEANDKEFTAFAFILYKTDYFNNIRTFEGFKKLLAEAYNRKQPLYKPNAIKDLAEKLKVKYHCLDKLQTK
ncbi:MAG: hypothetical protein WCK18_19500 [Prolixibacteraceae bacterium]